MIALIIDESLIFGFKVCLLKSKNYGNKQDARFHELKWPFMAYNKVCTTYFINFSSISYDKVRCHGLVEFKMLNFKET